MRRSRESLQTYQQQGDDNGEDDVQQNEDESQYDEEADEDDEEQQSDEQHEEDDEDEAEEEDADDDEEANESVEQQDEVEDDEQYAENDEDEGGLDDTKELEEHQQRHEDEQPTHLPTTQSAPLPALNAAPASSSSLFGNSISLSSSSTPFSFPALPASTSSFSAFPASSSTSLSAATKATPFGSVSTSVAPLSFTAGSSASSATGSSFTFPAAGSLSASYSTLSMPSFTFPAASSSMSTAPSASFSSPPLSQAAVTSAASAPANRLTAASINPSASTSASVSTTTAGTTISVPLSTSSIAAVWSPSDDLLFYSHKPATSSSSAPSRNNQPAASDLFLFRWPPIYGETSTLLHAWHAVFASTQRQAAERAASRQRAESMEWRLVVLSQSHCYRAELEACLYRAVQSLSSMAVASELKRVGVSESEYHSHLRVLESVSSTWHLFELLYLDPHDNLTVQLTDWMQRSYLAPSLEGLAVDSDEWWEGVLGLLVQGRLTAVVDALHAAEAQLLQFVSADVWQQLLELIETLPSLTAHATSVSQLVALVRDYRLTVQRLASSSAALMSHPFLPYLLAVLAGDEQAIGTISPTWMQLLVARLIFNQPHTTKADIPQLVTQCIQQMDEKDKTDSSAGTAAAAHRAADGGKTLDALREHVLCFRIHAAVLLADQMFDMPYFTAHLVDLLHHAALMPTLQDDVDGKSKAGKRNNAAVAQQPALDKLGSMTPRDWYVSQYVQSIIAHERLWTLTPEYVQSLTTPSVRPVQALCTLLMRQPCSSYAQLSQLQAMAARLQLPALVGQQLALQLAHHMLRTGQIGSAVAVYQRGGEEGKERVRQIARKLLFALIKGNGDADGATGELTTAMERVLDNVSEQWLDEERGSVDLLLLQHWADYTSISRQLHSPSQHAKQSLQPKSINVFQGDQSGLLPQAEVAVAMDDGAEGEAVGGLLQDGVTLLASLLTAPLVVPSTGAAVVYTPQCFHLPLLVRLCELLQRVEASKVGCELSAGAVRDVLHALSRCELSWQWEVWKAEAGVSDTHYSEMRRTLLSWLQQTSMAEESAKRVSVRV